MSDSLHGPVPDHGVPDPATEAVPTGLPDSGRHHTETAVHEDGGDAAAPKHDHGT